jgi:hypothetical protein
VSGEPRTADYERERKELRALLKVRVQGAITSASPSGCTVTDPAQAAEYVVNALMEYPDGQGLVRRIARYLDRTRNGSPEGSDR